MTQSCRQTQVRSVRSEAAGGGRGHDPRADAGRAASRWTDCSRAGYKACCVGAAGGSL